MEPLRDTVRTGPLLHMSSVLTGEAMPCGSSLQDTKLCWMYERGVVHPWPTQEARACVAAVWPSTLPESYDSASFGARAVEAERPPLPSVPTRSVVAETVLRAGSLRLTNGAIS